MSGVTETRWASISRVAMAASAATAPPLNVAQPACLFGHDHRRKEAMAISTWSLTAVTVRGKTPCICRGAGMQRVVELGEEPAQQMCNNASTEQRVLLPR